jgi:hypothetical protein
MLIEQKVYELPSENQHTLEIVKIGDLQTIETSYGPKEKFAIKIKVLGEKSTKGEDLHVTLNVSPIIGPPKSTLTKFLRRLGVDVTGSFEMDELIGTKFRASIAHNEGTGASAGKTFANLVIDTVAPLSAKPRPPVEEF